MCKPGKYGKHGWHFHKAKSKMMPLRQIQKLIAVGFVYLILQQIRSDDLKQCEKIKQPVAFSHLKIFL